ncbi:MAG: F0F1 ATP synthase subunit alpha, partial [Gammaproteobacteria bacterium]
YPGDIFYLHSRLLERSASVRDAGSITALPIVETQAQDIAAYIPTNLISITDGQLYLSPVLMRRGALPAIDVGRSVSRVGGKAQLASFRAVAGDLRLAYAQFEELESFSRFATRLDPETRAIIERGRRVREIFKQPEHRPLGVAEQIAVLRAVNEGLFDRIDLAAVADAERLVRRAAIHDAPELAERIEAGERFGEQEWEHVDRVAREAFERHSSEPAHGEPAHGEPAHGEPAHGER